MGLGTGRLLSPWGASALRRSVPTAVALAVAVLTLCHLCQLASTARHFKDKVRLIEPTGEVNPHLDNVEFDPLLAEIEQEQDDRAWEEKYQRLHHRQVHAHAGNPHYHDDEHDGTIEEVELEEFEEEHEAYRREEEGEWADEDWNGDGEAGEPIDEALAEYDHFNISDRLQRLFPLIDTNPVDDLLSLDELTAWHESLEERNSDHRARREMDAADTDRDGLVSLEEALADLGVAEQDASEQGSLQEHNEMLRIRFVLADTNNDSVHDYREFSNFVHPEESDDPAMRHHLMVDEMKHRDHDSDGKINFDDFYKTTYHEVMHHGGHHDDPLESVVKGTADSHHEHKGDPHRGGRHYGSAMKTGEESARRRFQELDADGDGVLSESEFEAIMHIIWPKQRDFAQEHSQDLIQQADNNKDGHLSLGEMLAHPHAFYNTVSEPEDDTSSFHDEF